MSGTYPFIDGTHHIGAAICCPPAFVLSRQRTMTSNPESEVTPAPLMTTTHSVVRHVAATLAYRASKVLRDVPPDFPEFVVGDGRRTPVRILAHLADLMAWGVRLADGELKWQAGGSGDWDRELQRFFDGLATLDSKLALGTSDARSLELLIQGPLADALTHVGVRVGHQPVAGLHDVAVGVVVATALGVRHAVPPAASRCPRQ